MSMFKTKLFLLTSLIIITVSISGCDDSSSDDDYLLFFALGSNTFTVGGSVSGLLGSGLVLQNNGSDDLALSVDGSFTFSTSIEGLGAYNVTVLSQPGSPNQSCSVSNGNGNGNLAGADINDVSIVCVTSTYSVGGNVSGLLGSGLVLQNNGSDNLAVSANGSFTFSTAMEDLAVYDVTVLSQPEDPYQVCNVINGTGNLAGVGISDVSIVCGPLQVSVSSSAGKVKTLTFSWVDVGADHYKLLKNPDGNSGYSQVGSDLGITSVDETITVHLQDWINASYIIQACNALEDCTDSPPVSATGAMLDSIGYFKASNTDEGDAFGATVALSQDGNTLAVGTSEEGSNATGIDGHASNNDATRSGAVYVFSRSGATWSQQAYIKASNAGGGDLFGWSVALSQDGNTLVVGARWEDSNATGIDGVDNNNAGDSGAVYVFSRSGTTWSQQAYIKASNTQGNDQFGWSLALSSDGNTLAVGAFGEESDVMGIDGDGSNNNATDSGAVYVFSRTDTTWSEQAYIKASNTGESDLFGRSVALSQDGNTLAVGAVGEESDVTGIDGDGSNNDAADSGAVYVFSRSDATWSQQAYIKASNTDIDDWFGASVALSQDGNTLAVGAWYEDSNATGIGGDASNNDGYNNGAVYLFGRSEGDAWSQQVYIKASSSATFEFGWDVALSQDGNTLAVGTSEESSNARGIDGDASNTDAPASGVVYMFSRSDAGWSQQAYIKASNTGSGDGFGRRIALSQNGNTLAVGAGGESSSATGIGGDQSNNDVPGSGAVYLY